MDAIVLARDSYREYDQIISLYTKQQGAVRLVAKGIKKITSKNSATLQPGSIVDLGIAPGKEYDYVTSVSSILPSISLRTHPQKQIYVSFFCSTLARLVPEGIADDGLYECIQQHLQNWEEAKDIPYFLLDDALLQVSEYLGFRPFFSEDIRELNSPSYIYSFADGGLVSEALHGENAHKGQYFPLSKVIIEALEKQKNTVLSDTDKQRYHQFVLQFMRYSFEQPLADWQKLGKYTI